MTDQEINEAIALHLGWKKSEREVEHDFGYRWTETEVTWISPDETRWKQVKPYCNDLNSMHHAEEYCRCYHSEENAEDYESQLVNVIARKLGYSGCYRLAHATARQRAEALLRHIGKWRPE